MRGLVLHDRFTLRSSLGKGGGGEAWLATDALDGREVVVKVLASDLPVEVLSQEFAVLARLAHPHVLPIVAFGFGREEDRVGAYYVSELQRGTTLEEAREPWQQERAWIVDILRALDTLHQLGLRHGDLKASNVMVSPEGAVLIDFGCVAPFGNAPVSGTPGAIAPELLAGRRCDGRADLYSLGVLLRGRDLPPELTPVVARLCAEDPAERPQDAGEVLEALGEARVAGRGRPSAAMIGRARQLTEAEALLRELGETSLLWLHGPRGSGRTRLLDAIRHRAQRRYRTVEGRGDLQSALERWLGVRGPEGLLRALEEIDEAAVVTVDDLAAHDVDFAVQVARALTQQPVLLVVATEASPPTGAHALSLDPLTPAEVGALLDCDDTSAQRAHHATGGHVATLAVVAAQLREGTPLDAALPNLHAEVSLPEGHDRLLALLAIREQSGAALPIAAPNALTTSGWARLENGRLRLARPGLARTIEAQLPTEVVRAVHEAELEASRGAARVFHLACLGAPNAAQALEDDEAYWAGQPARYLAAAARLSRDEAVFARAKITALAGQPRGARSLLWAALRQRRGEARAQVHVELASACSRSGRYRAAKRHAWVARGLAQTGLTRARAANEEARAAMKASDMQSARSAARSGLEGSPPPSLRALLLDVCGVADLYLGDRAAAKEALEEAATIHDQEGGPSDRMRSRSYLGLLAFREGDLATASARFAEALSFAEEAELLDRIADAALNLGSARHQLGEWGPALAAYRRAFRLASALGNRSMEVNLLFNLAKLYVDIGLFTRAREHAARGTQLATEVSLRFFEAAFATIEAEVAARTSDEAAAARELARATTLFEALGAKREVREVALEACELGLASNLPPLEDDAAADVRVRWTLQSAKGDPAVLEGALELAQSAQRPILAARAHRAIADALDARGEIALAAEHRARAQGTYATIAQGLPVAFRAAFWAHPERITRAPTPESDREQTLERLLDAYRRLGSTLEPRRLLEIAMDAAIEVSGAERGMVLLWEKERLRVAVARNLDRERLGRAHVKYSRTIAQRVIETGEALTTNDAARDERLSGQSIHSMRLKSVACVPIAGPDGIAGALYLDNRFQSDRFGPADLEVVLALASHVAISLENARLHERLQQRTRELEAERRRVQSLLDGQAAKIVALSEQVRDREEVLEHRFGYDKIIGRGSSMRELLGRVDRVVDAPFPVLIEGESGTGKELIARAIHVHGERDGRFVAINCGALPATLLEAELFGYVRGAFTGADRNHQGLITQAAGGTLFLDEIGEMPLEMQVKMLRVLQEREVRPVGSVESHPVTVRIVAATNRNLSTEVDEGRFREDLYYRLGVMKLRVPPLRERLEDLPLLCRHLLRELAARLDQPPPGIAPAALRKLATHRWPGNVRELENVLARALMNSSGEAIPAEAISLGETRSKRAVSRTQFRHEEDHELLTLLREHRWNITAVAKELGVHRATVHRKLKRLGVERPDAK